jgi:hypothetical protein
MRTTTQPRLLRDRTPPLWFLKLPPKTSSSGLIRSSTDREENKYLQNIYQLASNFCRSAVGESTQAMCILDPGITAHLIIMSYRMVCHIQHDHSITPPVIIAAAGVNDCAVTSPTRGRTGIASPPPLLVQSFPWPPQPTPRVPAHASPTAKGCLHTHPPPPRPLPTPPIPQKHTATQQHP